MANQSYVESVLLPDERLEYAGSIHWVIFVPGLASCIGGAFMCLLTPDFLNQILPLGLMREMHNYILYTGAALVGGGVLMLGHAYVRLISTELAITNRRVIAKGGFISRVTFEIMLGRVEGANIDQTAWGRLLGFGSIYVHGTGGGITPIDHVAQPMRFKQALMTWV
ncbi:MAG TPA: PH domain-containing protein, partial [Alphaproteobacteria bacterium]|nr:PH domain-containing protein [Alphaproteobacteria bacterium]